MNVRGYGIKSSFFKQLEQQTEIWGSIFDYVCTVSLPNWVKKLTRPTLHRPSRCSQTILVKPEATITLSSEVMAFIEVFRHHHTGSGKRSGSMPPPFIPQQQIHPHFNHISLRTSPSSSPVSFFTGLVRLQARCSLSHPRQLFLMFPLENLLSSSSSSTENSADPSLWKRHAQDAACTANQKQQQQQLYFPPQLMQMMYSTTYNCATD